MAASTSARIDTAPSTTAWIRCVSTASARRTPPGKGLVPDGEGHADDSAGAALAADRDRPAVQLDIPFRNRQPQTGAARLRGKVGLEDLRHRVGVHAAAGVRHFDDDDRRLEARAWGLGTGDRRLKTG